MRTFELTVNHSVDVTLDETAFTEEFMEDFRKNFYPFYSITDHAEHLAQLYTRGIVDEFTDFIEGYGNPKEFGIEFKEVHLSIDCDWNDL